MPNVVIAANVDPRRPMKALDRKELADALARANSFPGIFPGIRSRFREAILKGDLPFSKVLQLKPPTSGQTVIYAKLMAGPNHFVIRRKTIGKRPELPEKDWWDSLKQTAGDVGQFFEDLPGDSWEWIKNIPANLKAALQGACRVYQDTGVQGKATAAAGVADLVGAGGTASTAVATANTVCGMVNSQGYSPPSPVGPSYQPVSVTVYPENAVTAFDPKSNMWLVAGPPGSRTQSVLRGTDIDLPPSASPPITASGRALTQIALNDLLRRVGKLPIYKDWRYYAGGGALVAATTATVVIIRRRKKR